MDASDTSPGSHASCAPRTERGTVEGKFGPTTGFATGMVGVGCIDGPNLADDHVAGAERVGWRGRKVRSVDRINIFFLRLVHYAASDAQSGLGVYV